MAREDLIQFRRDSAARWTSENPILDSGEFGIETDTGRGKVGNGTTAWTALGYFNATAADTASAIAGARVIVLPVTITGGTANAIVGTTPEAPLSGDGKAIFLLRPSLTNTGAATLAINGGAALSIRNNDGGEVTAGLLIGGSLYALARYGSEYILLTDAVTRSEVTYRFELLAGISSDTSLPIVLGAVPLIAYAPTGGTITHVAALCSRAGLTGSEASASLSLEILKNGIKHGSTLTISSTLDDAFTHNAALASALTFVAGDEIMLLWYASGGTQFTKVLAAARGYYT